MSYCITMCVYLPHAPGSKAGVCLCVIYQKKSSFIVHKHFLWQKVLTLSLRRTKHGMRQIFSLPWWLDTIPNPICVLSKSSHVFLTKLSKNKFNANQCQWASGCYYWASLCGLGVHWNYITLNRIDDVTSDITCLQKSNKAWISSRHIHSTRVTKN